MVSVCQVHNPPWGGRRMPPGENLSENPHGRLNPGRRAPNHERGGGFRDRRTEPEMDIRNIDEAGGSCGGREPSGAEWSRCPADHAHEHVDSILLERWLLRVRDGGGRDERIEAVRKKLAAGELVTDQALRGVAACLLGRL